jgi:hypothetical protein
MALKVSATTVSATGEAAGSVAQNTGEGAAPVAGEAQATGSHDDQQVRSLLSIFHSYLTVARKARGWWREHRDAILASTQFVLETIEKGLDGMPIPGPKAAFGAMGGVVKAIRVRPSSD